MGETTRGSNNHQPHNLREDHGVKNKQASTRIIEDRKKYQSLTSNIGEKQQINVSKKKKL